jgi:hypothetical protein
MHREYSFTVADVLHAGFEQYAQTYGPLSFEQYKVAHAIMRCHTPWLGGHVYRCEQCGHEVCLFNSCRNRHCPSCQAHARIEWVQQRLEQLLPVPYFHLVFTLPSQLRDIALRNRKVVYSVMFRAVSELLPELAANPRRLGGTIGFTAVLHTWTQTMEYHPHLHAIVPGGALSADQSRWKPSPAGYLFPIPVMRTLFRAKVLDYLRQAIDAGDIQMHGRLAMYENPSVLAQLFADLYTIDWVVYAKPPFDSPERVVKYLGAYTHRVAMANSRILDIGDGTVTFWYKDRRDHNRPKPMTLTHVEFIRRFMMHLVPPRFVRMRHYGLLGNRKRSRLLPLCMELLGKRVSASVDQRGTSSLVEQLTGPDPRRCPQCRKGRLAIVERIPPLWAAPAA